MKRLELTLVVLSFMVVLAALFQNCSRPLVLNVPAAPAEKSDSTFFAYPYSAKPNFYSSISLYRTAGSEASLQSFTFLGSAAPSDSSGAVPLQYLVKIQDGSGNTVCPEESGHLNPGFSTIHFSCISAFNPSSVHVKMTLTAGSTTETTEQVF